VVRFRPWPPSQISEIDDIAQQHHARIGQLNDCGCA